MKRKIMIVNPCLGSGGAEKVLSDIIKSIDKNKFEITLLLFNKVGIYLDNIPKDVKVKSLFKVNNKIFNKIQILIIKYFSKYLYNLSIKEKYDVEIAFLEGAATKFVSYSNNVNSKKIAWIHTDISKFRWYKNYYRPYEEQKCYKKFDNIIFVSNDAIKGFNNTISSIKSNQTLIYNPIIKEEIIRKSNLDRINYNRFTIISVGRLNKVKGFDRLIKAHAKLVSEYPHDLVIIGEGQEKNDLLKLICDLNVKESVKLMGFVKNPYPYIKSGDLFVCSSRVEGYSLVVAEAVVLGKAILSTDVTGPREILNNGKYGYICENTIDGIYKGIKSLLINKQEIRYLEKNSLKRSTIFNHNIIVNKIEKILLE